MTTVTVSPKFQVVIPKAVRDTFPVTSGMKLEVIPYLDRIEFIPVKKMNHLKGLLKTMDTSINREKDRL